MVQSRAMPDAESVEALRAAVDTIAPPAEGVPGAIDLGVDRFVVEQMEAFLPGLTDLLATLLDAYADGVESGTAFADLSPQERGAVLREMSSEESQDLREALSALFVFTLGGAYSEWPGTGAETGEGRPTAAWRDMGYPGPSLGHPAYRDPS